MSPRGKVVLLGAALLAGLPLAFLGAALPPNEYEATLGIRALDCDGPIAVYLVAVPALALYGLGLAIAALHWRRPRNALVALACLVVCAGVAANLVHAVETERNQNAECRMEERR